jgi:sugar/nucleoside kinase (ribokinase family)
VNPQGGRAIYMSPAATSETTGDYIRAEHADYIRSAKIVSTEISQLPLDAVVAVLEVACEAGVVTVLDVDIPRSDALKALGTAEQFERALQLADYIKPSKAAVIEITGESDALLAAQALRKQYGAKAVVITDGEAGCAIAADDLQSRGFNRRGRCVFWRDAGGVALWLSLDGHVETGQRLWRGLLRNSGRNARSGKQPPARL